MTFCPHCNTDSATVRTQAELIEDLEQQNAELRKRLTVGPIRSVGSKNLTAAEGAILGMLLSREQVSKEELLHCYKKHDANKMPDIKIVDVYVCRLRAKVKPIGLEILTVWGLGFRIPREQREEMNQKLAA